MAKRKLAGAALKASNKKKARLARARKRRTAPKKKGRRTVARKKRRRSRRGGMGMGPELKAMMAGAGAGWLLGQTALGATIESRVPKIGNQMLTYGTVLWIGNRFLKNAWVGRAAKAVLSAGAVEFGKVGFKMSGEGDDSWDPELRGHHMSGADAEVGAIDVDEFIQHGEGYEPDAIDPRVGGDDEDFGEDAELAEEGELDG